MNVYKYQNKKNWKLIQLIAVVVLLQTACTKNFDEYNTNPDGITRDLLNKDNVGIGAFFPQMEENVIIAAAGTGDASVYQVAENLNADLFSGYMATSTPFGGGQNNSQYKINDGWSGAAFNNPYNKIMSAWLQIQKSAETTKPDLYALANIIKIAGMHRVTDIFGPIPYSKYGSGGFAVDYDAQEAIYNSFFSQLDASIAILTDYVKQNPGATPAIKFDLVYKGNYMQWIKFANALKLRLAMRIVYANPSLAQKKAEEAVNNSYGVLTTNGDNAFLSSGNGFTLVNPLWVINAPGYADIRAGAVLQSLLSGYNDPRLAVYFQPSTSFPGQYLGIRNGIAIANKDDRIGFSQLNVGQNQPLQWMTAAEVYFLRAEGAIRGWNMGGAAQSLYETGIQTSFSQLGVVGYASYIADATSTAAPYTDPVNSANNVQKGDPILSTVTIKWNQADNFEKMLERIITQKYLAMYPNAQEAWTEFRRTGYPKVWPVVVNYSGGSIDTKAQIRRLPYIQSEYSNNATAIQKAVSLLSNEAYGSSKADNGGTRLWWDKNPLH
ncbi:RagB/SusD family nutrient uptake outer membrane protein [Pedobacter nototheniae]|uniref:RagB/SusD family nutrient uptake outer membrane protein n=1 Tax=Pedobacter nototheniae TaxID=2488994 RepID=UPI00292D19F6|nr:RagB/SusD family nutrient uptake outer membrane protein [Pedobacter nototheniae]